MPNWHQLKILSQKMDYADILPSPFVVVFMIGMALLVYWYSYTCRNIPPGPIGLPVLGYAPFFGPHPQQTFVKLGAQYGNIFSLYMGPKLAIILNDYEAIKAAYMGQADIFTGRPDSFTLSYINLGSDGHVHGIAVTEDEPWRQTRRFMLQTFRDLGMGKAKIQDRIVEEAERLNELFAKEKVQPFDPFKSLYASVASIICILCFGKRFDHQDPRFKDMIDYTMIVPEFLAQAGPLQSFPILRFLPGKFNNAWQKFVKGVKNGVNFTDEEIEEHRGSYDENETRDYIDAFCHEQNKRIEKNEAEAAYFQHDDLNANLRAFFGAGIETTTSTLLWAFLFMLHHPEVQEKVHKEIDEKVGIEHSISNDEKHLLPYTEAVLREVQRLGNVTPFGILRANLEETTLLGYRIPKRCFIVPNYLAVNRDPKLWEKPSLFKPERFLNSAGKLTEPPQFMPFSIGKRSCVGESLARMEIFLFFANVMQKWKLIPSPNYSLPGFDQYTTGISCRPLPYKMDIVGRGHF